MAHFAAGAFLTGGQVNTIAHQGIQLIEEKVLESNTSVVTFSDIPQDFRTLTVSISGGVTSGSTQIDARFNGDTGTNYSYAVHLLYADATYSAPTFFNDTKIEAAFVFDSLVDSSEFNIPGYSRTDRQKLIYGEAVNGLTTETASEIVYTHLQALWKSTSAITSIEFRPRDPVDMAAGSIFQLYGLGGTGA